jgi:hypothetical protein
VAAMITARCWMMLSVSDEVSIASLSMIRIGIYIMRYPALTVRYSHREPLPEKAG